MEFVVVNIGCIECGVSSQIGGRFSDEAKAERIAKRLDEKMSWREGGQNSFEVFKLEPVDVVHHEYISEVAEAAQ